ncbi:MAG: MiaB/RimO family radical SAM methylthiotransferase [Puniceicoccales bacterium]|jgi:threonylcarbamoyladenosine tRNA methylthiotransferase MtaB|nr:MiaB/RimO family radical SAM methylthiotransferase [Puniceicoccales bacterium]
MANLHIYIETKSIGQYTSKRMPKKACLLSFGCRLNQSEIVTLGEQLEELGIQVSRQLAPDIDLLIINTCAVTNQAISKCTQTLRSLVLKFPRAHVIVTGCYSILGKKILSKMNGIDLIVSNSNKNSIAALALEIIFKPKTKLPVVLEDPNPEPVGYFSQKIPRASYNKRYNLKIQNGCNFFCSYCIIPFTRGSPQSRDFENILEDAKAHAAIGLKEIIITGVNIGTYENHGRKLLDVINALDTIDGIVRIRISSIEFKTIDDKILEKMADKNHKLAAYLHIPIQSAANPILSAMKRRYSFEEFYSYTEKISKFIPGIGLGTDIMVGFPGESEKNFLESVEFLKTSPIQYAHVFTFSPRPGTPAAISQSFVSEQEKLGRSKFLRQISREKKSEFYNSNIGQIVDVLFEDRQNGKFPGYTENYIKVLTDCPENITNQIRRVKVVKNEQTHVIGELIF